MTKLQTQQKQILHWYHEMTCYGTSGFVMIEFKKDETHFIKDKIMYTLKLISEHIENPDYLIEEKEDGKKDYKIKGIFMNEMDIKNRNGRIYPMEVLNKEVKRYNKEYINEKRLESWSSRWPNSES